MHVDVRVVLLAQKNFTTNRSWCTHIMLLLYWHIFIALVSAQQPSQHYPPTSYDNYPDSGYYPRNSYPNDRYPNRQTQPSQQSQQPSNYGYGVYSPNQFDITKIGANFISQKLPQIFNNNPQLGAAVLQSVQQGAGVRQNPTTLTVSQGTLRGKFMDNQLGKGYIAFMGVPYATAPIGPLRFKAPVTHPGWSGVLDAIAFRDVCPQFDYRGRITGKEDCLFVNIFTPASKSTNLYPVMVFIHGGNFESGSANSLDPIKLVDKDIIVVTFNYRLGILGFLSMEDSVAPGNYGLHDQNLALRWVRDNIGHFGGNPNEVTLAGQGAGAVSVYLHIMSRKSEGLFQRAIAESGTPVSDWAIESHPRDFALSVGSSASCNTDSSQALIDCLTGTPAYELLRIQQEVKAFNAYPLRTTPVIEHTGGRDENAMVPEDPMVMLDQGQFRKVPLIAGYNSHETAFLYPLLSSMLMNEQRGDREYVRTTLLPKFFRSVLRYGQVPDDVLDAVYEHYFRHTGGYIDINGVIRAFVNMSTDAMFGSGHMETITRYSRYEAPVYSYLFEYRGDTSMLDSKIGYQGQRVQLGPSNGDELLYLFDITGEGLRPLSSSLDRLVSQRMINLWTDFVKFGIAPQYSNFEYPSWPRVQPNNASVYRIGRDLRPSQPMEDIQQSLQLWGGVLPALRGQRGNIQSLEALTQRPKLVEPVYRTLAWSMVTVCIALLIAIAVLLFILYNQKKSQSFQASPDLDAHSRTSPGSTLY